MGTTETIKQRRVDVYLKNMEQKERWTAYATSQNSSLSKVIINTMESLIVGDLMDQLTAKESLTKDNEDLKAKLEDLQTSHRRQEQYIELLEKELARLKNISFKDQGPGMRRYSDSLIRVLKESRTPVNNNDLMVMMKIDPNDSDIVTGVSDQLQVLSSYGLVKYSGKGWIWHG